MHMRRAGAPHHGKNSRSADHSPNKITALPQSNEVIRHDCPLYSESVGGRPMAKTQRVDFIVEYENGFTTVISINRFTVSRRNYWALRVAEQLQSEYRIPSGAIRAVRRIPSGDQQKDEALAPPSWQQGC